MGEIHAKLKDLLGQTCFISGKLMGSITAAKMEGDVLSVSVEMGPEEAERLAEPPGEHLIELVVHVSEERRATFAVPLDVTPEDLKRAFAEGALVPGSTFEFTPEGWDTWTWGEARVVPESDLVDHHTLGSKHLAAIRALKEPEVHYLYNETTKEYFGPRAGRRAYECLVEKNAEKGGNWVLHTLEQYAKWYEKIGQFQEDLAFRRRVEQGHS